jgi:predicted ATPase
MLGSAMAATGRDREGLQQIRKGLSSHSTTGAGVLRPGFLALLATAHGTCGEPEAGLAAVAEAESRVRQSGERWAEAEIHRLKGELTWSVGASGTEPERSFLRSIEVAKQQQARSSELRATTSLARLWAQHGERQKAHHLLAPIYGWFTEGFERPTLRTPRRCSPRWHERRMFRAVGRESNAVATQALSESRKGPRLAKRARCSACRPHDNIKRCT